MRLRLLLSIFSLLLPIFSEVHGAPGKVMEAEPPDVEPRNALDLARAAYPLSARYELPTFSAEEQRRIRALAARTRPMYSGIGRELSLAPRNWVRVGRRDGFDVWQVQIRSPQAVELQVHFSDFDLDERSFVNVYSVAATRRRVQRYTGRGPGDGGRFWSQPTTGDVIVVEFWTPVAARLKPHAFPFANARISHTFRREDGSLQGIAPAPGADAGVGVGGAQEDPCPAFNSVCDYPQASTQSRRSTARYWTVNSMGRRSGACTGTLINNESGDGTLYFLTAWHCVDDVVESVGTPRGKFINATFEFSQDGCGSPRVTGENARFVVAHRRGDYALLRIEGALSGAGSYTLSGWDPDFQPNGTTVSTVHHASAGRFFTNNQKYAEATIESRWHLSGQEQGRTVFSSGCMADGCSHYQINYTLGKGTAGASGASVVRGGGNAARIVGVLTHVDAGSCRGNASAFAKIYEDGRVRGALTYGAAYYKGDGAAAGFDDSASPDYEYVGPPHLYPPLEGSVSVGGSVTGTIESTQDRDWFQVTLEEGRLYRFDLEGADSQRGTLANPYLYLTRTDRRTLAENNDGGRGRNARLGYAPPVAGDYYLRVLAVAGTGTYTLSVSRARDDVAGGRDTTATIAVAAGATTTATGTIDFPGDEDWFRATLAAGRRYRFDLEGAQTAKGTLVDPFLSVRGSDGEPLLHGDDVVPGVQRNSRLSYAPPASGLYYIVADAWNDDYVGSYTLTVAENSAERLDDYPGRRDSTATIAIAAIAVATTGTIDFYGDRDWFGAPLEAGRGYRFDLQGHDSARGTLADPYLRLTDGTGALLREDDDGGGGRDARIGYVARDTGLHYLIAGAWRNAGVGTYTLEAAPVAHWLALDGSRAPLAEGDSRDYQVVLGLAAGTTLAANVTVRWALVFDGAGVGIATPPDFIAASGTLAFAAGDARGATKTFTVTARDDDENEGDERYSIYLQAPDSGQFFAGGAIAGTIADDDAISVALPGRTIDVSEGRQTPVQTFALAGARPTADVVLPYTVHGTRVTPSDYALEGTAGVRFTSTAAVLSAAAVADGTSPTFVVRALEDGIGEGRERMVIVFDDASARSAGRVAAHTGPLYVDVEANGVTQVTVHARVFLQGAYDAGSRTMKTAVIDRLPVRQPYGVAPWGHPQTVGVPGIAGGFGLSDAAPDAVDWMLMELRTSARGAAPPSADASQMVERKAGLLLRDGGVAGIDDGASSAAAAVAAEGVRLGTGLEHRDRDLYVLLHHRNHLPVMSAQPATSGNCGADYCVDFTVRQSHGNNQRELAGGAFGMIAGDVNRDGTIDSGDAALIRANNLTVIGNRDYDPAAASRNYVFDADLDFDGEVLSLDRFFVISNDGAVGCRLCRPE